MKMRGGKRYEFKGGRTEVEDQEGAKRKVNDVLLLAAIVASCCDSCAPVKDCLLRL